MATSQASFPTSSSQPFPGRAGLVMPVDSWPSEYPGLLGCHGLDNGLYEIYAGADTSSRGECSHGCFNGETQLGRGEKRLEKGREGASGPGGPGVTGKG